MCNNKIINIIKELDEKIYKIQCKNWVLSKGSGNSAAGKTFEKLLGKQENSDVLPDYKGIEIKTKYENSKYPLRLFSCALDNKPLENKRLLNLGGYPDKNHPEFKIFQITIRSGEYKKVGKYKYTLKLNNTNNILELLVVDSTTNGLHTKMSWTYRELQSRLEHKLKYLVVVSVRKEKINNKEYFKYFNQRYFKLKSFHEFLKLINSSIISVSFKLTYNHSKEKFGKYEDKGTSFEINYTDITKLFSEICVGTREGC